MSLFLSTAVVLLASSHRGLGLRALTPDNDTCSTICKPMSELASDCGYRNSTDMMGAHGPAMMQCICENASFNVSLIGPLCASCYEENGMIGGGGMMGNGGMMSGADMSSIMSACNFTSTSYTPAAKSLVAGIHVTASPAVTASSGAATQNAAVARQAMLQIPIVVAAAVAMLG